MNGTCPYVDTTICNVVLTTSLVIYSTFSQAGQEIIDINDIRINRGVTLESPRKVQPAPFDLNACLGTPIARSGCGIEIGTAHTPSAMETVRRHALDRYSECLVANRSEQERASKGRDMWCKIEHKFSGNSEYLLEGNIASFTLWESNILANGNGVVKEITTMFIKSENLTLPQVNLVKSLIPLAQKLDDSAADGVYLGDGSISDLLCSAKLGAKGEINDEHIVLVDSVLQELTSEIDPYNSEEHGWTQADRIYNDMRTEDERNEISRICLAGIQ